MRFKWQDYDDMMAFEEVLKKIREKRITNVTVSFEENVNRLHYKLEGDIDDKDIAKLIGFTRKQLY